MGNPIGIATNDDLGGQLNITVRGNDMNDSLPTNNKGIMLLEGTQPLTNFILEDNYIHGDVKTGTINFSIAVKNAIIRNNLFMTHPTTHEGILRFYASIGGIDDSDGIEIYNNTFVAEPPDGSADGILMFKVGTIKDIQYKNVTVKNNIIDTGTKTNANCIYIGNTKDGSDVPLVEMATFTTDYNAYQNLNATGRHFYVDNALRSFTQWKTYLSERSVAGADVHSNFGQVSFTDEAGGNFTLVPSDTVALDQGTPLASLSDDKNGTSRPQGKSWDIGAYEFVDLTPPKNLRIIKSIP